MLRYMAAVCFLFGLCPNGVWSQDLPERMPREDVIEVPAIGKGLCVSNVFQTNMVLQRDKPVSLWGWAEQRAGDRQLCWQ